MFCDIKDKLDRPAIQKILSDCLFDGSPKGVTKEVKMYQENDDLYFYGVVENDTVLGIVDFQVYADKIEILHISVARNSRSKGVGSQMVFALQEKYHMLIEAETDDDTVSFYKKCGFETIALQEYGTTRYTCILKYPKPLDQITNKERAKLFPIVLSEHNPEWKVWFAVYVMSLNSPAIYYII